MIDPLYHEKLKLFYFINKAIQVSISLMYIISINRHYVQFLICFMDQNSIKNFIHR